MRKKRNAGRETDVPKRDKPWGSLGGGSFSFLHLEQNWLCVNAAAEGLQKRTEMMVRMQQEVRVKESRRAEEIPQRWWQPQGEIRTEMKEEAKLLRCTIGLEHREKVHEKIQWKVRCLFGIENRLKEEEMEEQFNREAKERWRFAADAARITDERTGSEDQKHTSV